MHAAGAHRLVVVIGLAVCVTQSHCMEAVDGNFVFGYEIPLDRFGQTLGTLDTGAAGEGRMPFHFKDVTLLAGHAGSQVVELFLGCRRKNRLAAPKCDFCFRGLAFCAWVPAAVATWLAASAVDCAW